MAETESRSGIIAAIKNPLGITALIILVAETLTLFAMGNTPKSDPFFKWYYIIMIGLLVLFVPAYYIYISKKTAVGNKTQTISVGEQEISAGPTKEPIKPAAGELFMDSSFGFSFLLPEKCKASPYLNYKEYLTQTGGIKDDDAYKKTEEALNNTQFGELFLKSTNIIFQYGEPTSVAFTKETSTNAIEQHLKKIIKNKADEGKDLTAEEISDLRHELNFRGADIDKFNFTTSFSVSILPKKWAAGEGIDPNLANLFLILLISNPQPMDELVANKDSILYKSTNTLQNIVVNDKVTDLINYRIERLVQSKENFFFLSIQWSPGILSALETWSELQKMFESFRIIEKKD